MKRPLYYSVYLAIALSMTGFAFANNYVTVNITNSLSGLITNESQLGIPNFNSKTNQYGWWIVASSTGAYKINKGDAHYDPSRQFKGNKVGALFSFSYVETPSLEEKIFCDYKNIYKNITPTKTLPNFAISISSKTGTTETVPICSIRRYL